MTLGSNIDWNGVLKDIEKQILTLAAGILQESYNEASNDVVDFLAKSRSFIVTAGEQLALKQIDPELFQIELRGRLQDAEFHALKHVGIAQIRLDSLVQGIETIIVSAVIGVASKMI